MLLLRVNHWSFGAYCRIPHALKQFSIHTGSLFIVMSPTAEYNYEIIDGDEFDDDFREVAILHSAVHQQLQDI